VLGWSDGARVALLMTCIYPNNIKSTIILAIPVFMSEQLRKALLMTKNLNDWGEEKINNYLESYNDLKEIKDLYNRHMIYVDNCRKYFGEDFYKNMYHKIKCPVLVIHGDMDWIIDIQQSRHVFNNIKSAKLYRFPSGTHNLHQVLKLEFKTLVEKFLNI